MTRAGKSLCDRHVQIARQTGALAVLPIALNTRMGMHLFAGELKEAAALVDEFANVNEVMGNHLLPYGALALAAWRGRHDVVNQLSRTILADAAGRGEGMGLTIVDYSSAVLHNSLGQYREAMSAAIAGAGFQQELAFAGWSLVELVEAAVRCGDVDRASEALDLLTQSTSASGTDWALGIEARSRAQVASAGKVARAVRRGDRAAGPDPRPDRARSRAPAVWRVAEAAEQNSRRTTSSCGRRTSCSLPWVPTDSRIGPGASSAPPASRYVPAPWRRVRTSPRKRRLIARLAAEGRTNPEIGAHLFISPRTVEWHLAKVFAKLDIRSRRELRSALPHSMRANTA